MKIKVGIFFGGPSREREISFAGGRTVYDNLNKTLFEPVPLFVDSRRNLVLLDWPHIYKGTIRDFFPPADVLPPTANAFQIYSESLGELSGGAGESLLRRIGRPVRREELSELIDVAFLALHGEYGEDGQIQQELADLGIPYTGSGVRASQIGMNKALQKDLMGQKGFARTRIRVLDRKEFLRANLHELYASAGAELGFPLVIRPANQGSSIGVSIIGQEDGIEAFERAVNRAFFRELIPIMEWQDRSMYDRVEYVRLLGDIRDGLGFPLDVKVDGGTGRTIYHPEDLLKYLNDATAAADKLALAFTLEAHQSETQVILESFIRGKEFSCIVIRNESGHAVALPPTEIVKGGEVFDYRSKYLPGLSRKITPIDLPAERIEAIRRECERLFDELGFQVYARIDGFHTPDNEIFLNDPNTTSGMLPSSFFFHQAAEIGLNPSQFLTYILRISLQERLTEFPDRARWQQLLTSLDEGIRGLREQASERRRIAIFLGGYSFERHISVESGRNIFEKLSSSTKYEPLPIFLTGEPKSYELYQIPINLLLKDNADDIRDKILHWQVHPIIDRIKSECADITRKYASANIVFEPLRLTYNQLPQRVDGVFIALHGRPGEDGEVQRELELRNLPYNGSGVQSSSVTINKHKTLQILQRNGLPTTEQLLLDQELYDRNQVAFHEKVEENFLYPLIAKPVDDGCSSAVKVIRDREELEAYTSLTFHPERSNAQLARQRLRLKAKEEFPRKNQILFERLVRADGALHFLEITGGMLTHYQPDGTLRYEVFEPSEALAGGEVLSLEEKFLAGEGQNITPARLAPKGMRYEDIAPQVRRTLETAARILNVEGYCRIDAFVRVFPDGHADTLIIEVNSLPGMTPATAIFHQAALAGYKPAEFIDKILEFGFERERRRHLTAVVAPGASAVSTATTPWGDQQTVAKAPFQPGTTTFAPPREETQTTRAGGVRFGSTDYDRGTPAYTPPKSSRGGFWAFMTSTYFLKNLAVLLAFFVGLFFFTTFFLSWYTNHGETLQVHNYTNMKLDDAIRKARSRGFRVEVIDSTFDPRLEPYVVLQQDPIPLSRVKKNRTIYLSISGGTPPQITLPTLVGNYDYQQYTRKLEALKIRYAIKDRVYDPVQEENTILHFFYGDRQITDQDLRRGVQVPQGAQLDFVVTVRQTGEVELPNLVCRRYSEALFLLSGLGLVVGEVSGDVGDQDNAFIYVQEPAFEPGRSIAVGQSINLQLTASRPEGCPADGSPMPVPESNPVLDNAPDFGEEPEPEPIDTSGNGGRR